MWYEQVNLNHSELSFDLPYVNAAGSLGFYPDPKHSQAWGRLGAFITNPISFKPRNPPVNRAVIDFPGGFLLHTAFPNSGFVKCSQKYREKWAAAPLPVIVHILPEEENSLNEMICTLESYENIQAVELSFPEEMDPQQVKKLIVTAEGELPIIMSITPAQSRMWYQFLSELPIALIRLSEPYGILPVGESKTIIGRLFGPATFPTALYETSRLAGLGFNVIGGGGVFDSAAMRMMFAVGAKMVAFDTVFWNGGFSLATIVGEHQKDYRE